MKRVILALFALVVAATTTAQSTTASLFGFVTDSEGKPLVGATVVATHLPTETLYGAVCDKGGAYHLQGLRVGGPYRVEFSFVGYKDIVFDNLTLALGEQRQLDATLADRLSIEEVVVQTDGYTERKTGTATAFGSDIITRTPTVSRSIDDITRLAPQAMVSKENTRQSASTIW